MRLAKADKEDLETTLNFFQACETGLEKGKFSLCSAEDQWEDLDDDDPDKIRILKIRKDLAVELGQNEKYIDNRIVMYEFLQEKFMSCCCNWRRVIWAADALIHAFCDPTLDYLASAPGIEQFHVAPEQ